MATKNGYVFTRKFLLVLAAAIIWIGLPAGIYFFFEGVTVWGAILTLFALAVLILSLDGRILRILENRFITKGNALFMIIGWLNSALIIIVYLFISTSIYQSRVVLIVLYMIVTVFLLVLSAWFLLTSKFAS